MNGSTLKNYIFMENSLRYLIFDEYWLMCWWHCEIIIIRWNSFRIWMWSDEWNKCRLKVWKLNFLRFQDNNQKTSVWRLKKSFWKGHWSWIAVFTWFTLKDAMILFIWSIIPRGVSNDRPGGLKPLQLPRSSIYLEGFSRKLLQRNSRNS